MSTEQKLLAIGVALGALIVHGVYQVIIHTTF